MNKRQVGTKFEQDAADYLMKLGYEILHRNFRCKIGEIDLIAKSEEYLCFIEVKYRSSTLIGFPAEAITPMKIRRITRTAEFFMLLHNIAPNTPCRFDVVVILDHDIELIKNAFGGL